MGRKPDYRLLTSRIGSGIYAKGKRGRKYYRVIGRGWKVADGGILIEFSALSADGKCVLYPVKK